MHHPPLWLIFFFFFLRYYKFNNLGCKLTRTVFTVATVKWNEERIDTTRPLSYSNIRKNVNLWHFCIGFLPRSYAHLLYTFCGPDERYFWCRQTSYIRFDGPRHTHTHSLTHGKRKKTNNFASVISSPWLFRNKTSKLKRRHILHAHT